MAAIPPEIENKIIKFIQALSKNSIHVQQAFLFGSYASGTFDAWSDIDLALISEDFSGNRFQDRNAMRKIKLAVSSDIETLPYRPEDFTAANPFVKKIMETGIRVV